MDNSEPTIIEQPDHAEEVAQINAEAERQRIAKMTDFTNADPNQFRPNPVGRPTKMTPQTIEKLEQAFMLGCTDEEACLVADISTDTLYLHQRENPEFIKRKEALKQWPNYQARTSVIEGIKKDPELALKYLSKKKKDEFSDKIETDITSKGEAITGINYLIPDGRNNTQTNGEAAPSLPSTGESGD